MTNKMWLHAMIGAPIAAILVTAPVLLITDGPVIPVSIGIGLLTVSFLIPCISRLLLWIVTRRGYSAFEEIAKRNGGAVEGNVLGEKQLRIPQNDSTIIVEYRATGSPNGGSEFWTRVGWEIPGGSLLYARWHIDEAGEMCGNFPSEGVKQAVKNLRIKNLKTKVQIDRESVSIEVPSYLQEVNAIEQLLALSMPRLKELLSVWTRQIENPHKRMKEHALEADD